MKYAILPFVLSALCALPSAAYAGKDNLRGDTFCYPAKDVPKIVGELAQVKPERRNIVDVRLKPRFIIKDGGVWPEKFYLAKPDGEVIMDMPFSRETGAVPSFIDSATSYPKSNICIDDPTRAHLPEDDEGLYFEMGLAPLFKVTTGQHSLAELEEAAKDAKKFYKKMLPDVVSMFMPNTDYFAIKMIDRKAVPAAFASLGEDETEISLVPVDEMWVLSIDDVADIEGANLNVRGGPYDLQPVPSPKTLRKFVVRAATDDADKN